VPDVTGIDKIFDYLVPSQLVAKTTLGCRVRINLNGRRVGGCVVSLVPFDEYADFDTDKLSVIVSVSGAGVEPELINLTQWIAAHWWGSWRAVLSSATAPRARTRAVNARYGPSPTPPTDEVAGVTRELAVTGGGLLVIPPLASALNVVATLAVNGPVLAVCPTQRMASVGAASLRRRGFTTAVVPQEWEAARAGVDVVIGARSAVLAPCAGMSSIVVIDEHDELLQEERAPTWDAPTVAIERARRAGVVCIVTSAVPSLRARLRHADAIAEVTVDRGWPQIRIVDLANVPVSGSLLSSEMLESVSLPNSTTVIVLNTKGKARLIACKSCRALQACTTCESLLTQNDNGELVCERCSTNRGSVCVSCGRASFVVARGGTGHLKNQLEKSQSRSVVEVTAESDDSWTSGSVFLGTEAVLYRVPSAQHIVFADIDRDLGAPRMSAPQEVAALIARAARIVGAAGSVVVQTRQPQHPLLQALASENPQQALSNWADEQMSQSRMLGLPPFSEVVKISVSSPRTIDEVPTIAGINMARTDGEVLLRAASRAEMSDAVAHIRSVLGTSVRVHANPARF
jgi:primosomal protein N' (replication factor Y)